MLRKMFFSLMLIGVAYVPFMGNELSASENDLLARVNWNININTGFAPCYYGGPYYNPYYPYYYSYPPCAYPCPPPYWW